MNKTGHEHASKLKVLLPAHTLPRAPAPSAPPAFHNDDNGRASNEELLLASNCHQQPQRRIYPDTQSLFLEQLRINACQNQPITSSNGGNISQLFSANFQENQQQRSAPPSDVLDDEPEPSAPSLELLDKVTGYENVSFDILDVPPPVPATTPKDNEEPERKPLPSGPVITEAEARQALLKFASQSCCYGKAAAREMAVTSIKHTCAFHYTLETFSEKRQTAWAFEPFTGGFVDGPSEGQAPGPWDIPATPTSFFQNCSNIVEVPHTACVKMCHNCGGVGRKRCYTCSGNGWEYCNSCHGDVPKCTNEGQIERCFQCNGTGRKKCWKCGGDGLAVCRCCAGTGQIKCFIQLTVIWTNHMDDHIVERSALPGDKIKLVTGQVVFTEERPWVFPINHFPDSTVNMASTQLIQQHSAAFPLENILMQRHRIRIIPVATVNFQWRGESGNFIVFGFERKIHAPDYPQKCCCCCTLF